MLVCTARYQHIVPYQAELDTSIFIGVARFSIPICTAWYRQYVLVHQVTGTRTTRYRVVPPKLTVGGRSREKKGRRRRGKEEKRKKKEDEKKKEYLAPSSPTCCRRPHLRVAHEPSPPSLAIFLPRGEQDRGDVDSLISCLYLDCCCSTTSFTALDKNYLTPFFTSQNEEEGDSGKTECPSYV
ncbi:hypothetical protein GW17_00011210 [Ensete ventricosum]|nr:hypothetical protein GW17_00011210 [Ensete ventricosum]